MMIHSATKDVTCPRCGSPTANSHCALDNTLSKAVHFRAAGALHTFSIYLRSSQTTRKNRTLLCHPATNSDVHSDCSNKCIPPNVSHYSVRHKERRDTAARTQLRLPCPLRWFKKSTCKPEAHAQSTAMTHAARSDLATLCPNPPCVLARELSESSSCDA